VLVVCYDEVERPVGHHISRHLNTAVDFRAFFQHRPRLRRIQITVSFLWLVSLIEVIVFNLLLHPSDYLFPSDLPVLLLLFSIYRCVAHIFRAFHRNSDYLLRVWVLFLLLAFVWTIGSFLKVDVECAVIKHHDKLDCVVPLVQRLEPFHVFHFPTLRRRQLLWIETNHFTFLHERRVVHDDGSLGTAHQ